MMRSELILSMPTPGLELVVAGSRDLVAQFEASEEREERIRRKRCRILVVDNDALFLAGFVMALKSTYGATVEQARNGTLAIEKCRVQEFHLVLMDVYMGETVNGIEAALRMRDGKEFDAEIVLMSAHCKPEEKQYANERGLRVLDKPIAFSDVEDILLELTCCGGDES